MVNPINKIVKWKAENPKQESIFHIKKKETRYQKLRLMIFFNIIVLILPGN